MTTVGEMTAKLPAILLERVRVISDLPVNDSAKFVLYWMRTAVRAAENPALDVAIEFGNRLGLPVFVYHALSDRYPFASDRHHTFILQGAKDVQAALAERNIGYAFHLEREGHRGPWLIELANRAALVITEEMPVQPVSGWTKRLAKAAKSPVLVVWTQRASCPCNSSVKRTRGLLNSGARRNGNDESGCYILCGRLSRNALRGCRMICLSSRLIFGMLASVTSWLNVILTIPLVPCPRLSVGRRRDTRVGVHS